MTMHLSDDTRGSSVGCRDVQKGSNQGTSGQADGLLASARMPNIQSVMNGDCNRAHCATARSAKDEGRNHSLNFVYGLSTLGCVGVAGVTALVNFVNVGTLSGVNATKIGMIGVVGYWFLCMLEFGAETPVIASLGAAVRSLFSLRITRAR